MIMRWIDISQKLSLIRIINKGLYNMYLNLKSGNDEISRHLKLMDKYRKKTISLGDYDDQDIIISFIIPLKNRPKKGLLSIESLIKNNPSKKIEILIIIEILEISILFFL